MKDLRSSEDLCELEPQSGVSIECSTIHIVVMTRYHVVHRKDETVFLAQISFLARFNALLNHPMIEWRRSWPELMENFSALQ